MLCEAPFFHEDAMADPSMRCPSCGADITGAARFCAACCAGLTLSPDAPTLDAPHTPQQPSGTQPSGSGGSAGPACF